MGEYWRVMSCRHHEKLLSVVHKDLNCDQAMRRMVKTFENDNLCPDAPKYFRELITASHIDRAINVIVL